MPTLEDIVTARGWTAAQALEMAAMLEAFVDAIWRVHGADTANLLQRPDDPDPMLQP